MIRGFHRRESGIHRWWQVVQGRGGVEDKIPGIYGPRGIQTIFFDNGFEYRRANGDYCWVEIYLFEY
jgi:hypothetical protein